MKDLWNDSKTSGGGGLTPDGSSDAWPSKANPGTTSPGAPAGTASVAVKQSAGGTTRDEYWANKEARDLEKERVYREEDIPAIRRSTAYNCAATLGAAALAGEALSFGSVAKGKRLDMYLGFIDQIADHVYARLNGESLEVDAQEVQPDEGDANDSRTSLG